MSEHLFELEVGDVICPIRQAADELAAGACPTLLRLPDMGVGTDGWVVLQSATARHHGLFDVIARCAAVTGDLLNFGCPCF
jgi:hypothetical protein